MNRINLILNKTFMVYIIKYKWVLIGGILGAVVGYAYYYFVGCESGNCAITSKPFNSSLYGALMGGLMGDIIKDFKLKSK